MDHIQGQLRVEAGVVLGVDLPAAAIMVDALGYDRGEVLPLVTSIEAGIIAGMSKGDADD